MFTLSGFQKDAVEKTINAYENNIRSVCIVAPTGAGKTVISSDIIKKMKEKFSISRFLYIVNLQVLVEQTYETINYAGKMPDNTQMMSAAVIHDEIKRDRKGNLFSTEYNNGIMISMPETYVNTVNGKNSLKFDTEFKPDVIFFDEAHKATTETFRLIRDMYPNAFIIGLTATPYRSQNAEGDHMREWFGDNFIFTVSIGELIDRKFLATPIYKVYDNTSSLTSVWKKLTAKQRNKRTIVFTKNTRHSIELHKAFSNIGVKSAIITAGSDVEHDDGDYTLPPQTPNQRNAIYEDFENGEVEVLLSVNALCEGFDSKLAKYCFLDKNVTTPSLYQQMIGRVLRKHQYKHEGFVVDFHNNVKTFGKVEDFIWEEMIDHKFTKKKGIESNSTLTLKSFSTNNVIMLCCESEGCNNVYDIKKTPTCPVCNTHCGVKITQKVGDIYRSLNISTKKGNLDISSFKSRWDIAIRNDEYSSFAKKKINELFTTIFDSNGNIISEYKGIIEKIFNKKVDDIIELSI